MALKTLVPAMVTEKEGNLMIDRNSFDPITGRTLNRRIVIRDGIRRDKPHAVRFLNPSEIGQLLAAAGLEVHAMVAGWNGQPLTPESRRIAVVARKPS